MIQIGLVFDYHNRAKKGEEGPVEVRVTVNRKPYYIYTGVRVRKERWLGNAVRDVKFRGEDDSWQMTEDADILNQRLTTIVRLVEQEVNECLEERRPIDVKYIRDKVWNIVPKPREDEGIPTLVVWIKEQAAVANITTATKKRYQTLCNKLSDYGKMTRWEDLTVENIYKWDVWLRQQMVPLTDGQRERGAEERYIGASSVYNYHKCLMAMLNRALKMNVVQVNPYDRMKGTFKRVNKESIDYLTEEQMKKVLALTPVPGSQVAMARDLFIFQSFTGLSYCDTQLFDIGNYRKSVLADGSEQWRFVGERIKTGVPYVSMLLPPAVEVLKRNNWKVPKMNNQRYNQMLKAIGMCVGIEKLHSHMGRHTFATMMLSKGVKIENVSRMLGHTNITQTQRYAKVLAEDVFNEYEKVADLWK